MPDDLDVVRTDLAGVKAVVLGPDDAADPLAFGDVCAAKDPRIRIDDDHVALNRVALVLLTDHGTLGPGHWRLSPVDRDARRILSMQWVLARRLVTHLVAMIAHLRGFEANLPKRRVGSEEHQVDTVIAGSFDPVTHLLGPILVVPE